VPNKPILLIVDDNPDVREVVERDLRDRYGDQHEVRGARSGAEALELLRTARQAGDPVALVLADQRMPRQDGREVLAEARPLAPTARRVLLTLPEDAEAGLEAINAGQADDYLLKPWLQPEQRAFPLLDDLIQDWHAGANPAGDVIQVIGSRWSPEAHRIRDFLARNLVAYRWLDVETAEGGRIAERVAPGQPHRALVAFPDGSALVEPGNAALAEKTGLRTRAAQRFYDLLIVGAGPAGLAAAVYGASEGLRTALVEVEAPGGQAGASARIENYLGFPAGLSGSDLTRRAVAQARRFGAELLTTQAAVGVQDRDGYRVLTLADGSELSAHALIVATGVSYRTLDIPGAERLNGAGIYYGSAMTEAVACRDEDVYVVGGANSAGQAAVYLAGFARRVTMLVRGPGLSATMSSYLIDRLGSLPNVAVRPHTRVVEATGGTHLEAIAVRDDLQGTTETLTAAALFAFIGAAPRTEWLAGIVARDEAGYVLTGADALRNGRPAGWTEARDPFLLETSVAGIFAAGDVRHGSIKRVASGVGEGAMAVSFVHQFLATR
jgi:thioredoxin reductase (NADPH)